MVGIYECIMESRLFVLLHNNYFDPEHDGESFICFITE